MGDGVGRNQVVEGHVVAGRDVDREVVGVLDGTFQFLDEEDFLDIGKVLFDLVVFEVFAEGDHFVELLIFPKVENFEVS